MSNRRSFLEVLTIPRVMIAVLTLLVCGCEFKPIAEQKSLSEANVLIATLAEHGVDASLVKESGSRGKYSVRVPDASFAEAVGVLARRGILSEGRETFSELIETKGLLPASREMESLRLDHAQGVEIEEAVRALPGVRDVKAVVRSKFLGENESPTVSIVVRAQKNATVNQDQIRAIAQGALPGVAHDAIQIIAVESSDHRGSPLVAQGITAQGEEIIPLPLTPFLLGYRVPSGDFSGLAITFIACMIAVGVLGVTVGYWYRSLRRSARRPGPRIREVPSITRARTSGEIAES